MLKILSGLGKKYGEKKEQKLNLILRTIARTLRIVSW